MQECRRSALVGLAVLVMRSVRAASRWVRRLFRNLCIQRAHAKHAGLPKAAILSHVFRSAVRRLLTRAFVTRRSRRSFDLICPARRAAVWVLRLCLHTRFPSRWQLFQRRTSSTTLRSTLEASTLVPSSRMQANETTCCWLCKLAPIAGAALSPSACQPFLCASLPSAASPACPITNVVRT